MRITIKYFFVTISLLFFLQPVDAQDKTGENVSISELKFNLEYLASDEMEGREATTKGEELAAEFISEKLVEYGIEPFGDDGSYFQVFDVDVRSVSPGSYIEIISADGEVEKLSVGDDFYLSTSTLPSNDCNDVEREVIFAGYGISAEKYDYDDYEGVEVRDKVVLIYRETPQEDGESIFSEEDSKKFSDTKYKLKNAIDHGAAGLIFIPSGLAIKYWKWLKSRALSPSFKLIDLSESTDGTAPSMILSKDAVETLLDKERYSYEELIDANQNEEKIEWFELSKKIKFNYSVTREKKESRNIIGIIEGIDDKLKNEFVTVGAHYDHEGIINGEVYNGADDNASGTSAILEIGRRLVLAGENNRSVLLTFHAAEEKGLLGSKYLTGNSDFINDVVVNINMDMVGRESVDSIFCIGSGKLSTELYELVGTVNEETVNFVLDYTYDDPNDPNRYYYRSDHYNFARYGIPIVFFYDHMTVDYSKPTDDADKINFQKIDKLCTLVTELALRIANLDHRLIVDKKEEKLTGAR